MQAPLIPSLELFYSCQGYKTICGIDEAGRGPLAGPVVAAACILPQDYSLPHLNDSKKLTPNQRAKLFAQIIQIADYGIASASVQEIDDLNILNATMLAMHRALSLLKSHPDLALVDGTIVRGFNDVNAIPIKYGDTISPSIAAASVLAKVSRDDICFSLDELYPGYGFAQHKGYPTPAHKQILQQKGPIPSIYRKKFIRFLNNPK